MRVMVTGATGFVGGHTLAALLAAGHEATVLVRDEDRLRRVVDSLGCEMPDVVIGDMTDPVAVQAALEGADAALHCAAFVSLASRDAAAMVATNLEGTELVLRSAVAAGCDPIVHTSSTSALFRPGVGPLTPDLDITDSTVAYSRSKAACERVARALQVEGAPVTITYPSGILGPPAGDAMGETGEQVARFVAAGIMPTHRAALSLIDVRDLAALNVALFDAGLGPRRIMCGGHLIDMHQLAALLRDLTGRRFPVPRVPPAALRTSGKLIDAARRVAPFDSPIGEESMTLVTMWNGTDDASAVELGLELRPAAETLAASLDAWVSAGHVTAKQAGTAVTSAVATGAAGTAPSDPPRGVRLPGWAMSSKPLRWLGPRVFPAMHRSILKLTRGRTMLDSRAQPMLLLTSTGSRSGLARETPLATVPLPEGTFLVVGSNFAQESHPAWTSNLLAKPEARITFHGTTRDVRARLLTGDERAARWQHALRWYPGWSRYEQVTDREFRLFELTDA